MRAAAYARISDDRDGQGLGVERQRQDCLALVEREGWQLVDVFADNSVSAYNGKAERPAWRALLEACVEGRVDVVVAYRDDRLWRDVVEERQVTATLAEHGVQRIVFASGRTYELGNVDDALNSGLQALVAEHESAVKGVRVRRKLEELAADGKWRGGPRPYGYRRATDDEIASGQAQSGSLVIVEFEADIIRECARRVLAGEPLSAVSNSLNERGVPTATDGVRWRPGRLRELLTNPTHAGLNRFRGEIVGEGRWEPILDRSQHEALSAMLASRRRPAGRTPTRLLTGLLTCYRCGGAMAGNVRRGVASYKCRADKSTGACGGPSISSEPADAHVRDRVLALLADSEAVAERLAGSSTVDVGALTEQLAADERRRDELVADYYSGDVPSSAYQTARERLEARIAETRSTLAVAAGNSGLADAPIGDGDALQRWWKDATPSQRRALVEALIERVELKRWEPRMGRKFSPERLYIVWRS